MRIAEVYYKSIAAGVLTEHDNGTYEFRYYDLWLTDKKKSAISLTLPKTNQVHVSSVLFPFFYHLLPEGTNKKLVCDTMRIEPDDYFSLLVATAKFDTIGAITIERIK